MITIQNTTIRILRENKNSIDDFIDHKNIIDDYLLTHNIMKEEELSMTPTERTSRVAYMLETELMTEKHDRLEKLIDSLDIEPSIRYDFKFTKKEIKEANYFKMATYFHYVAKVDLHPSNFGTKFEAEIICDECGLKEYKQLGRLKLDTQIFKKKKFIEFSSSESGGHIIVAEANIVRYMKENFSGISLKSVEHLGSEKTFIEAYQIIIDTYMPNLSTSMTIIDKKETCNSCGLTDRHIWPLHYQSDELGMAKDFNLVKEKFTYGGYIQPNVVISKKVKEWLEQLKIKGIYEPIIEV